MGLPVPDLPILTEDDSMLSRKFGREIINYFSGSPLNRVSFLRGDHGFLRAAFAHPAASFLLMRDLAPLGSDPTKLAFVGRDDVVQLTGIDPFRHSEAEMIAEFNSDVTKPVILFLGLDERNQTGFEFREYKGNPFFAVDATPKGSHADAASGVLDAVKSKTGLSILPGGRFTNFSAPEGKWLNTSSVSLIALGPPGFEYSGSIFPNHANVPMLITRDSRHLRPGPIAP